MRDYLISLRKDKGWAQVVAASACQMSQSYYSALECGTRQKDMSIGTMQKLSLGFGIPLDSIIESEAKYTQQAQNTA